MASGIETGAGTLGVKTGVNLASDLMGNTKENELFALNYVHSMASK